MTQRPNLTCQLTSYHTENPPPHPLGMSAEWLAIATAHVYEDQAAEGERMGQDAKTSTGQVLQVVHGRASAATEEGAMVTALKALLVQLEAREIQRTGLK